MGPLLSRFGKNKFLIMFAGVAILLIVVLLVISALNPTPAAKTSTDTTVFGSTTPTPTATPTANTGNYFVVPELGVKFDKSSDLLSDLVYTIKTNNGRPAAYFSSARLKAGGGARCGEAYGPLGILALEPTTNEVDEMTVIGSNYLNFSIPAQPCSLDNNVMVPGLQQAQALRTALQKVIVVQ
jgi:hypothetical protein